MNTQPTAQSARHVAALLAGLALWAPAALAGTPGGTVERVQTRQLAGQDNVRSEHSAKLGSFDVKRQGAVTYLESRILAGELQKDAVTITALENPKRLVVDIQGAQVSPKWQRVAVKSQSISQARVANKPKSVRFVLDVKGKTMPSLDVEAISGKLRLAINSAALAKAETPAIPVAKTAAPAPVAAATKAVAPAPAPSAIVKDVRFEPRDGFVRFIVEIEGDVPSVEPEASAHAPRLRVKGTHLPATLARTLDVSTVAPGVLTSLSSYESRGDTILSANIESDTEYRHWRRGNRLMWDFRNNAGGEVLPYAPEQTAGYASQQAVNAVGRLAAEARYTGRRISLDLKDAEVKNVLRLLADVSKLNIVAADDVDGRVTIKLRNVPWDQALDIILASKQLDKVRQGNIIRVAPAKVLQDEEQLRLARRASREQLQPLTVRLVPVSYSTASEIKGQVQQLLSDRGKVNVDARTNVLIIEDIKENVDKAERLVRTLDTQTPQVLIEARIVEAQANFSRQLGIQWGGAVNASQAYGTSTGLAFPHNISVIGGADDPATPTMGVTPRPNFAVNLPAAVGGGSGGALGFVLGSANGSAMLNLRISAAETAGKAKIVSAPKVLTLDNQEATILAGEQVPITVTTANGPSTRFIDANLSLKVTPHVTQDGSVLLNIEATKNEISSRTDNMGVPGIVRKEAKTQMIVGDGDTAVLGGIYKRNQQESQSYVPWLGKVPILGWLFKRQSNSDAREELLIFVSPRIVNREQALLQTEQE